MKITRTNPSEATIQAELYMALKGAGIKPVLEQVIELPGVRRDRYGRERKIKIRVDVLLLTDDHTAFAAIEVKNKSRAKHTADFAAHRQYSKYRQLGLPFTYCTTMGQIAETVAWALANRPLSEAII